MIPDKNIKRLEKLTITAYKDSKGQKPADKKYTALINPGQFTESYQIKYTGHKSQGENTTSYGLKFNKMIPTEYTLELIFDATGVLAKKNTPRLTNTLSTPKEDLAPEPVEEQIKRFKGVVIAYDGETHEPYYLRLQWGKIIFQGRLTALDIVYTVFRPDGTPLRAKASATFKQFQEEDIRALIENKRSPDLTHIRTVGAGDTLPLMAHRIYGDFSYYLEVARVNRLKNYRNLKPGTKLSFPPIDKKTA